MYNLPNIAVLLAEYNLGVDPDKLNKVENLFGYKFAWGENMSKNGYTEKNYTAINDDHDILTYNTPTYKYNRIDGAIFTHTDVSKIDDPVGYMLYPNSTWYDSDKQT